MVAKAFDTPIIDDGEALIGPWGGPQQMLAAQVYDGHVSIHDNAMAQKVGFKAATIEGPTHFSQFDPLCERLWGDAWFETGCISAHKVYMPDGTTLEAHSGYGNRLDDPHHVDERMRGATPPTVYDLKLRESLFHGVRAIRLIPEDEDQVFGRSGILAHTYMLGPNGDSNGCVSFKDYNAFLQAYLNHRIKRLAVVTRLD